MCLCLSAGEQIQSRIWHNNCLTWHNHRKQIEVLFGDHSDVMACRQTGFAMLAEGNVQEVMDLGAVAHLATIEGKVPFLNFFDGFRTSHEIQKVEVWDFNDLKEMCNMDAVAEFRAHALNPNHPAARGSHENGDTFFQHREACNKYYDALPAVVEKYMDMVNAKIGTDYKLFNYYGAPDADRVIIAMGSICDVTEEVVDYLNAHGEKVGLVKVRLYRPFCPDKLIEAIPATAKKIAVLDRTKEPGAQGEPLYLDVVAALANAGKTDIQVIGGQASKASNIGQVAQFAAAGKEVKKKSLAEIAMSYGYVYVAQVAMGANQAQTLKAIKEAEAYNGPSLIIGYAPCEMHSIKGGMVNCQKEMKKAVDCGYWNMFRFNLALETKKFTLDSKAPAGGYREFLMNEARYSRLTREFPSRAEVLFQRNEDAAKERYEHLVKLVDLYAD